jgi:hypothetical protein
LESFFYLWVLIRGSKREATRENISQVNGIKNGRNIENNEDAR